MTMKDNQIGEKISSCDEGRLKSVPNIKLLKLELCKFDGKNFEIHMKQ